MKHLLAITFLLLAASTGWGEPTPKVRTINEHTSSVMGLSYSPDGKTLASSSRDKTIKLWDAQTDQLQRTITGHTEEVCCVAYSPKGDLLASSSGDKTVRI